MIATPQRPAQRIPQASPQQGERWSSWYCRERRRRTGRQDGCPLPRLHRVLPGRRCASLPCPGHQRAQHLNVYRCRCRRRQPPGRRSLWRPPRSTLRSRSLPRNRPSLPPLFGRLWSLNHLTRQPPRQTASRYGWNPRCRRQPPPPLKRNQARCRKPEERSRRGARGSRLRVRQQPRQTRGEANRQRGRLNPPNARLHRHQALRQPHRRPRLRLPELPLRCRFRSPPRSRGAQPGPHSRRFRTPPRLLPSRAQRPGPSPRPKTAAKTEPKPAAPPGPRHVPAQRPEAPGCPAPQRTPRSPARRPRARLRSPRTAPSTSTQRDQDSRL